MVGTRFWRTIIPPLFRPEFPENRENNREFAIFLTSLVIFDIKSRINFNILPTNSLQIKTGKWFRRNRELDGFSSSNNINHHANGGSPIIYLKYDMRV